jgi:hypothetical protein
MMREIGPKTGKNAVNQIGNRQKALLHVAKARLGLTEEVYRDIPRTHGGVDSSVDLKWPGYQRVKKHLASLGFESRGSQPGAAVPQEEKRPGFASPRRIRMIQGLWADLSYAPPAKRQTALREFLRKRFGVADLRFLTEMGAANVINALLAMVKDNRSNALTRGKKEASA